MRDQGKEQKLVAHTRFVTACRKSIDHHCSAVLRLVPKEDLDLLDEETLALLLSGHVLGDVMELGLQIMCWRMVNITVNDAIVGMIVRVKEKLRERGQKNTGLEETSPLS